MRKFVSPLTVVLLISGLFMARGAAADSWNEQTHKAHTGDFNADGISDLFLQPRVSGQPAQIVLGLGDANYTSPLQEWSTGGFGVSWLETEATVLVGDFNGDGRDELLLQPRNGGNLKIFVPGQDGTIQGATHSWSASYAGVDWSYTASNLLIGDFDGDGRDDILLQSKSQSGQNATVLTAATGKPKNTPLQVWGNTHLGYNWSLPYRNLIIGDYNGDGRDDLLLQEKIIVVTVPLGPGGAPMPLVFRDGAGHAIVMAASDYYVAGDAGKFLGAIPKWQDGDYGIDWNSSAVKLYAADFNGDGVSEILLQGNGSTGTHKIVQPQIGGFNSISGFSVIQTWQDGNLGASWSSSASNLLIGDVNGDGRSDVLIQARGTGTTSRTSLGNSDGTLGESTANNWSEPPLYTANYAVGTVGGSFSVGPGGGASYSIPIVVAPGVGGMQPELSLVYNSQSGNGIAGVGWSLGGLSSIHRCARNLEQDGIQEGVKMDNADRLCLDGSRLVVVSGSYGTAGAEYRTEIDSYSKIVQNDAGCGFACGFTVYTKSGQIYQYGLKTSSQYISGYTSPMSWGVFRISDTVGNAITFNYTQNVSDGSQRISSIRYTERSGLTTQGLVSFTYNDRPDTSTAYLLGASIQSTQRLTGIASSFAGKVVRSYTISYEQGATSGLSLVDQIKECVAPGSANEKCFVPTHFTWTDNPSRFTGWSAWASNSNVFKLERCRGIVQGDANGDGLTDIICAYDTDSGGDSARRTYVRLSNGDSYSDWIKWFDSGSKGGFDIQNCATIQPADFNADGLTDLVCLKNAPALVYVQLAQPDNTYTDWNVWNTTSTFPEGGACSSLEIGDLDGDSRSDVICPTTRADGKINMNVLISTGSSLGPWSKWAGSSTVLKGQCRKLYSGDANGDGLTDMICAYDTTSSRDSGPAYNYVWLSTGTGFSEQQWNSGPNTVELQNCSKQTSADVNGDGLTDLVCPYTWGSSSSWYVMVQLSTGKGYLPWANWTSFPKSSFNINSCSRLIPADVDGDGTQDLVCPYNYGNGTTRTFVMRSVNGAAFSGWESWSALDSFNPGSCATLLGGDTDGNGKFDLICVRDSGGGNEQTFVQPVTGTSADLLASIETGAGAKTHVEYAPLTDNSVYTRDALTSCPGYPTICMQAPMYVVAGVSTSNGIGGLSTSDYRYKYGRANVRGRGWLGFGEVSNTDNTTGTTTRTVYNQEFSTDTGIGANSRKAKYIKSGVPSLSETRISGTLIGKTLNTWNVVPLNSYTRFELQSDTTTEYGYELNGSLVTTVTTQNSNYDSYGNVGSVSVTTSAGGQTFSKVTNNTYLPADTVNWIHGRLKTATVTSTTPTGSETRSSAFEYDPVTGLLTAEIVEPGDPQMELRTEYGYINSDGQNYGLKTSVTVKDSGSATFGIATRTSTTSYDFSTLATGKYSVISTNAKGHSETKIIDARYGITEKLTGPNGLITSRVLDEFGRTATEYRADGTSTVTSHAWCDNNCPPLAVRTVTSDTTGSAQVIQYIDLLGRAIRSETTGLNGRTILADTDYDARGQVKSTSRNYFSGDTSYWTETVYDDLGRVVKVTSPDGGVISTAYNGLTTTITKHDLNGEYTDQTITQIKDAIGQEVEVIDEAGSSLKKYYDPFGNLEQTVAPTAGSGANTTVLSYDKRGRKITMADPDMGIWTYAYDALGQLRKQTDNKGQITLLTYDVLGRMKTRNEAEGITTWTYDTASMGIGKLASITGPGGFQQNLAYDTYGRPQADVRKLNGSWFTASTSYTQYGQVERRTYPTGFAVQYSYNSNGYLTKAFNAANTNDVFWEATDSDADGNVVIFDLAGGTMRTARVYEPFSGRLQSITTSTGIQFLNYHFDSLGNLRQRVSNSDPQNSLTEDFSYDARNRLTGTTIAGFGAKSFAYDTLGNITQKGIVNDYLYGAGSAGPHAVTTANGQSYTYDANGNMVGGAGRTIAWTSYNKPRQISKGTTSVVFDYGPDRARYKQNKSVAGVTTTTLYFGKLYEQITKNGVTEKKHYINVGGSTIAIYNQYSTGAENIRYLHTDHLGSTDVITDEMGQAVERQSFDAFGSRRNTDWTGATGLLTSIETTRGFTGHEQLDEVGLVHMNGRVYDPVLGRFISADPQVQFASNLQSYNRYSYVHNNPLSFTDPSGFGLFKKIKKAFKKVGRALKSLFKSKIFQSIVTKLAAAACFVGSGGNPAAAGGCAAATTTAFSAANGGSLGDSLKAGVISFATNGILFEEVSVSDDIFFDDQFLAIAVRIGGDALYKLGDSPNKTGGGKFGNGVQTSTFQGTVLNISSGPPGCASMDPMFCSGAVERDTTIEEVLSIVVALPVAAYRLTVALAERAVARFVVTKGTIQLSKARFGHTFTRHGEDATEFLINRARGSGQAQGQFLDNQAAARFIQDNLDKIGNGAVSLPLPKNFPARIINPDGTFSVPSTIRLVPGGKGVKTAFPEP